MTLETFFAKFDQFAEAPDAVAKMRELVLELAVRGRLMDAGNGSSTAVFDLSCPFPIPGHWLWSTLSEVAEPCGQKKPDSRFTYVDVGAIDNVRGMITDAVQQLEAADAPSRARKLVQPGSVLYATVRPYLRNIAVVEREFTPPAIVSTAFAVLHPRSILDVHFLFFWLRSQSFQQEVSERMKGVAYPAISDSELWRCPVPVPPPAEQKRIVAKVDELMALCDQLEAQQEEREARHATLARAALARFADAPTPANLQLLFHSSYAISPSDLRKTILTLAVQGHLVPQNPNDEPAERLIARLETERREFAKTHKFRAPVVEPAAESSIPFELPNSWKWCSLSAVFNAVTDGDHLPPPKSEDGVAFLTIGNITTGKLQFEGSRFVPETYYQGLATFRRPGRGDILYTVVGATYGRPALVETDRPFCVQRHIAILKPPQCIDVGFLMVALRSPLTYEQAAASTTGTAQPTIPLGSLRNFVVPLPPAAEQRRIVAKVDELMALVDELEAQLAASRATGANLLNAVVAELTSPNQSVKIGV